MICKHANKLSAIVGVSQEIQVWNEWYLTFFFKGTDFELKKKKNRMQAVLFLVAICCVIKLFLCSVCYIPAYYI